MILKTYNVCLKIWMYLRFPVLLENDASALEIKALRDLETGVPYMRLRDNILDRLRTRHGGASDRYVARCHAETQTENFLFNPLVLSLRMQASTQTEETGADSDQLSQAELVPVLEAVGGDQLQQSESESLSIVNDNFTGIDTLGDDTNRCIML